MSKERNGRDRTWPSQGREGNKRENYHQFEIAKNCVNDKFNQNSVFSSFWMYYMIFTRSLFIIYIATSFTYRWRLPGYFKFHILRSKVWGKFDYICINPENSWTPRGSWGSLFPTPGTLGTCWRQGATKCQVEWWSGFLRESPGPRPYLPLIKTNQEIQKYCM